MRLARISALTFGLCLTLSGHTLAIGFSDSAAPTSPDLEMQQAKIHFNQGAFAQSAVHWMEAARLYERQQQPQQQHYLSLLPYLLLFLCLATHYLTYSALQSLTHTHKREG